MSASLNGHPGNVTRRVRAVARRAARHGLVVTATTDPPPGTPGAHASGSWHYPLRGRNRKGCAVDVGFSARDLRRLTMLERRGRLVAFQLSEYRAAKRYGFRTWQEILGPDNEYVLLKGQRADLQEGSPLERQHETHVHVARSPTSVKLPRPAHVARAARDVAQTVRIRRQGMRRGLTIIRAARKVDVPLPLALAVVEQESGGRNVYGHDAVRNPAPKGGKVTKANYTRIYLPARKRGLGMQGVGPLQLTWWEFQDRADRAGGCWKPSVNIETGLAILRANIAAHGSHAGIAAYNGSGPAAETYARQVQARAARWQERLA